MTKERRVNGKDDRWIPTACVMCYNNCGILAHRVNGAVVKIEGNPDCPQNSGRLCAKGNSGIMSLYSPSRVKTPLKRTNPDKGIGVDPKWVEISWDEALDTVANRMKKIREDDPRKLVWDSFDHMILNEFRFYAAWAAAYGTPNAYLCGAATYFCGNNLHPVGYLTMASFHFDPDINHCNYLVLIGAQHGFLEGEDATGNAQRMADARARGLKVVVVDPVCTPAASKADEWLPIRPGTDGAFALAVLNVLLNETGIYDAEFIKKHTNGAYLIGQDGHYIRDKATGKPVVWDVSDSRAKTYDDTGIKDFALEGSFKVDGVAGTPAFQLLRGHVKDFTCEKAAEITTIPAETIRRIAHEIGEAAHIGSKIVIEGKELPHRPVCVYWRKGANQHKHSMPTGLAIQFINIVLGAINVPGGMVGANPALLPGRFANYSYGPKEGPDGMVVPEHFRLSGTSFPAREVRKPETATLYELFPVAVYSTPFMDLMMTEPEKFKIPYKPEMFLHCWSNRMMNTIDPRQQAEVLKAFDFQVSFAYEIDETVEFADIVLPDAHFLETLFPVASVLLATAGGEGVGSWCFHMCQPVVEPPPGVRSYFDVLLDLADRAGFRSDLYHMMNVLARFAEPYKLDLNQKYTMEEILDRWAKSWFGPERGLDWFKEHGFISIPKKAEEVYPMPFTKARIPLYVEHFIKAGQDVKRVTQEIGLTEWDVSDYTALPSWRPCLGDTAKSKEYDLFPVTYRSPFHNMSHTMNNKWLNELGEYHPYAYYILMNSQAANRKGIKTGDIVRLEAETGHQVEGVVRVTDTVHPEVLGIGGAYGGHWARGLTIARGKGVHYNSLLPINMERLDHMTAAVDCCMRVKVSKTGEVKK